MSIPDPIVLVPAAGKGERFRREGFTEIKPLIQFALKDGMSKCMIDYALHGTDRWPKIVGIPDGTTSYIEAAHDNTKVVFIKPNNGQLDTIWALTEHCPMDGSPVMVVNSDVSFRGGDLRLLNWLCSRFDVEAGALVVERNDESAYSFVNGMPFFTDAAERRRLSPWALAGAYWFKDVTTLRAAIRLARNREASHNNEHYLSEVFQWFQQSFALPVRDDDYLEFGTPALLKATIERFK